MCGSKDDWVTAEDHMGRRVMVLCPKTPDLDHPLAARFREATRKLMAAEDHRLILADLGGIGYLDSTCLEIILALRKQAAKDGSRMILVSNETVHNILKLTQLTRVFTATSTKEEAIELLTAPEPAA